MASFMIKVESFKASRDTEVTVNYYYTGLGTEHFKYRIVFEFLSCEVHYDLFGHCEIFPMVDHYEPSEIALWYPDVLEDIENYFNTNKIKLFDNLIKSINRQCECLNNEIKYLKSEIDNKNDYID